MDYMSRPTEVLKTYLKEYDLIGGTRKNSGWILGRLSMALEILTVIKTLEDELVPMLTINRSETISVLRTLLRDLDFEETAEEWYERLCEWRKPTFVSVPFAGLEGPVSPSSEQREPDDDHPPLQGRSVRLPLHQSQVLPSVESVQPPHEED